MTLWENFKSHPLTPNGLSIFRGVLGVFIPLFLFARHPFWHFLAAALFTVGALTDYWDGYLARKHKGVSNTGKILDPSMDKILILAPLAAFAHLHLFSIWWLVPIFFREVLITFFRVAWLWEGKAAGAEQMGKIKFACQVSTVSAALLYWVFRDYYATSVLADFFKNILWILLPASLLLTLVSGISFFYSNMELLESPAFSRFAAACGVGLSPIAPGTMGTLLGLILLPFVTWNFWVWFLTFLFLLASGYWAVSRLDLSVTKDPNYVVIDEVLGIFITLVGVPFHFFPYLLGFLLFRLFDIVKPPPCRQLEKFPGFWGITFDDLMAGVYARLALLVLLRV